MFHFYHYTLLSTCNNMNLTAQNLWKHLVIHIVTHIDFFHLPLLTSCYSPIYKFLHCTIYTLNGMMTVCPRLCDKRSGPSTWRAGPASETGKGCKYLGRQAPSSCSNRSYLEMCDQSRECSQTGRAEHSQYPSVAPQWRERWGEVSSLKGPEGDHNLVCLVTYICELFNVVELTCMHWSFVIVTLLSQLPTYAPIWGTFKSYVLSFIVCPCNMINIYLL